MKCVNKSINIDNGTKKIAYNNNKPFYLELTVSERQRWIDKFVPNNVSS